MTGKFYFDGIPSSTLGIYIININSAEDTMPLFGGQTFTPQNVIEHEYDTFIRTTKDNIRLTMHFTLCDPNGIVHHEAFTPERLHTLGKKDYIH